MEDLPSENPKRLRKYLELHFTEDPQLLGGNHSTLALKKIVEDHTMETDTGEVKFTRPPWSNLTPNLLEKFKYRQVQFVISPLPIDKALKSTRIKHGLLCLARQLNDNAKQVKNATLKDQLIKARAVLGSFLRNAVDPGTKKPVFSKKQSVWPERHGDLEKSVYSLSGIQSEVKKVLSVEYVSCVSAIKVLCTCPDDVFDYLLKITSITSSVNKENECRPVVNSTKSLGAFTLTYCKKSQLIDTLQRIYALLAEKGGKAVNLTKFAADHQRGVKFHAMLNAIVSDLTNEKLEGNDAKRFANAIGPPGKEGFYEEYQFENVRNSLIFFSNHLQLYKKRWPILKLTATNKWKTLTGGGSKRRPDNWNNMVLDRFKLDVSSPKKGDSSQVRSAL